MDRRAVFFFCAAVVCAALTPVIPVEEGKPDISWVGTVSAVGFAVLGVLSLLDHLSRRKAHK
ncbi:MAG: hypothetical protein ABMA25_24400 [Ilumatobacteraceae bacterium]